ncbi:MAG: hypothetical protein ACR2O4_01965, partial [Hyphomicrobiaceae bacterium]
FYKTALRRAALETDSSTIDKISLPLRTFEGRTLELLSFTSFEGTPDDHKWFSPVQPGELQGAAPPLYSPRLHGPVEYPFTATSGIKSMNFAPRRLPKISHMTTLTATKFGGKLKIDGAKSVWIYLQRSSTTNGRPRGVHNCETWLQLVLRFAPSKEWVDGDWHICGNHRDDDSSSGFYRAYKEVPVPDGASKMEIAFAFVVQKNVKPMNNARFLIDDLLIVAEY